MLELEAANKRRVQQMSADGLAGKMDLVKPHISDQLVVEVPASLPYGGTYRGWDGYMSVLQGFVSTWGDPSFTPIELAATGNKVVVLSTFSAKLNKNGKRIKVPFVEVWEFEDGKVVRMTPHFYDTKNIVD